MQPRTIHGLFCECKRHIKLAKYGVDTDGKAYLHVRTMKSGEIQTDIVVQGGIVRLYCFSCGRWTQIHFMGRSAPDISDSVVPHMLT